MKYKLKQKDLVGGKSNVPIEVVTTADAVNIKKGGVTSTLQEYLENNSNNTSITTFSSIEEMKEANIEDGSICRVSLSFYRGTLVVDTNKIPPSNIYDLWGSEVFITSSSKITITSDGNIGWFPGYPRETIFKDGNWTKDNISYNLGESLGEIILPNILYPYFNVLNEKLYSIDLYFLYAQHTYISLSKLEIEIKDLKSSYYGQGFYAFTPFINSVEISGTGYSKIIKLAKDNCISIYFILTENQNKEVLPATHMVLYKEGGGSPNKSEYFYFSDISLSPVNKYNNHVLIYQTTPQLCVIPKKMYFFVNSGDYGYTVSQGSNEWLPSGSLINNFTRSSIYPTFIINNKPCYSIDWDNLFIDIDHSFIPTSPNYLQLRLRYDYTHSNGLETVENTMSANLLDLTEYFNSSKTADVRNDSDISSMIQTFYSHVEQGGNGYIRVNSSSYFSYNFEVDYDSDYGEIWKLVFGEYSITFNFEH